MKQYAHFINSALVLVLALAVGAGGYYLTSVKQPEAIALIEKQEQEVKLRQAKAEELLQQQAQSAEQARAALRKWKTRYRYIPQELETPDVVQHFEGLTSNGFDAIRIELDAIRRTPDFNHYVFTLEGTAYYKDLYELVWELEQDRRFFRINALEVGHSTVTDENPDTGVARQFDTVDFTMEVSVLYAGSEVLSKPEYELPALPTALLPSRTVAHNSFLPVIRKELPANDRQLVDIEMAQLLRIVGTEAVFQDEFGVRSLTVGDEVYLGRVTSVDPVNAVVEARLNKGGITKSVKVELPAQGDYRTARGARELKPLDG